MSWQPIETAPRNGQEIRLRRVGDETTYTGRWYTSHGGYWSAAPWTWHMKPSEWMWMPIPDPPVRGAKSEG